MQRDTGTDRRAERPGEAICRYSQFREVVKQLADATETSPLWELNYRQVSQEFLPPSSQDKFSLNYL